MPARKTRLLSIVAASKKLVTIRVLNELLPEQAVSFYGWVHDSADVEDVARLVTLHEIAANDHNLNLPRYVVPALTGEVLTVWEAGNSVEKRLLKMLEDEGLILNAQLA